MNGLQPARTLLAGFLALVLLAPVRDAQARTWYVDATNCPGPGEGSKVNPYCKIQDAIDQASAGDTVSVREGFYLEEITLKSGVDVLGDDATTTTLSGGSDKGDVVSAIGVTDVLFSGFLVIGARSGGSIPGGAGIFVNFPDATVVVRDVEVAENDFGIAIFNAFQRSGPDILESNVHHNDFTGIVCPGNGVVRLNRIWANGKGVEIDASSTPARITRNTFWRNDRGIQYTNDEPAIVTNNLFVENDYGFYEIDQFFFDAPFVQGNLFWNNTLGNYVSAQTGGVLNTAAAINSLPRNSNNLVTDPYLCAPPVDFGICATSPAFGGGLNGVTIGARGPSCGAPYTPYGVGLAGTGGLVPELAGGGCSAPGFSILAQISGGRGGAPGILALSFAQASIPVFGGTLLVAPPLLRVPHVLGGTAGVAGEGSASVPVLVPLDPGLVGLAVNTQALYLDPEAPAGVSMTGGQETVIQ